MHEGDNEYISAAEFETHPLETWPELIVEGSNYMNHSCSPTCVFQTEFYMVASRDINPGVIKWNISNYVFEIYLALPFERFRDVASSIIMHVLTCRGGDHV